MARSINNQDTDWRREWDEEQTLTSEERVQKRKDEEEERQIIEDIQMCELEAEMEEEQRELRRAQERMIERGWPKSAVWMFSDEELLEADRREEDYELLRDDNDDR